MRDPEACSLLALRKAASSCKSLLEELLLHGTLSIYLHSCVVVPESLFERSHPMPCTWSVLPLGWGYFLTYPE